MNGTTMTATATLIGQSIGQYRVESKLGQGGMGEVYKAVHKQLRRPAAVKILKPEMSRNREYVQRFFNEALAANVIQHPSLVSIFEAGYLPSGSAFLIMEYLEGETLGKYLVRESQFSEVQALLIVHQVASALVPLHAQDIIHRDLKPDNLMLITDAELPGGKRVKVLDFGLAKVAVRHQMEVVMTRDGISMGTPPYMAPEQWISANAVDGKADVYSLGVLLYVLLTGCYPFDGHSPSEFQEKHLYAEIPDASAGNPAVSVKLSALIKRMLAKKRSDRPGMKEILEQIDQSLVRRGALSSVSRISLHGAALPVPAGNIADSAPTMMRNTTIPVLESDLLSNHSIDAVDPSDDT